MSDEAEGEEEELVQFMVHVLTSTTEPSQASDELSDP
jgi:hypothetical protein